MPCFEQQLLLVDLDVAAQSAETEEQQAAGNNKKTAEKPPLVIQAHFQIPHVPCVQRKFCTENGR